MTSATPARATRHSTSKNGPNAGTATRINRKESPHSAPSKMRAAKSLGFTRPHFRIRRASLTSTPLPTVPRHQFTAANGADVIHLHRASGAEGALVAADKGYAIIF